MQCNSLGSMKAYRMRQRQFVFSADPKRLRTPSIFATDFFVRVAWVAHLRSWVMMTPSAFTSGTIEMHVASNVRTDGVVNFFLALRWGKDCLIVLWVKNWTNFLSPFSDGSNEIYGINLCGLEKRRSIEDCKYYLKKLYLWVVKSFGFVVTLENLSDWWGLSW